MSKRTFTEFSETLMMPWIKESSVLTKLKKVKLLPEADYHSDEEIICKESKKCFKNLIAAIDKFQKHDALG